MKKQHELVLSPILISKASAAGMLGISVRSIDYLIAGKKLETKRLGRRVLVVFTSLKRLGQIGNVEPLYRHS